jgi:hypothetical protein
MRIETEDKIGGFYYLDGKEIKESPAGEWYRLNKLDSVARVIRFGVMVDTHFLGVATTADDEGRPLVFETMVFGGHLHREGYRSATWDEAEYTHAKTCLKVFGPVPILTYPAIWAVLWIFRLGVRTATWIFRKLTPKGDENGNV